MALQVKYGLVIVACRIGMAGESVVDLRQLKALVAVVETGSVTKAAELLRLVQPAVTRQIRALEDEFGVPLFDRSSRGMQPTAAGVSLADRARRALAELDRARAELAVMPGSVTGIVTVGLLESTAGLLSEPLVSAILHDHPGIELRVLTAYSGHLQQWIGSGDLDLSLLYNLAGTPSLNVHPLVSEKLWAVAPPLAGLEPGRAVTLAEVAAHPLVMPTPGHGLRTLIDSAVTQAHIDVDIAVQTNSMSLQKHLVQGGHGWTILPGAGIAGDLAVGTLSAAPLAEPEIWRSIVLGLPRARQITPAVQTVARQLARLVRSTAHRGAWPSAQPTGDLASK
jgi:LysR family nitrogen assimilation transcriptional regulator